VQHGVTPTFAAPMPIEAGESQITATIGGKIELLER
jgi:hypothetical protein